MEELQKWEQVVISTGWSLFLDMCISIYWTCGISSCQKGPPSEPSSSSHKVSWTYLEKGYLQILLYSERCRSKKPKLITIVFNFSGHVEYASVKRGRQVNHLHQNTRFHGLIQKKVTCKYCCTQRGVVQKNPNR